ncbi:hypothetical protein MTO96_043329 [Rhipicephalus appendiculatus]
MPLFRVFAHAEHQDAVPLHDLRRPADCSARQFRRSTGWFSGPSSTLPCRRGLQPMRDRMPPVSVADRKPMCAPCNAWWDAPAVVVTSSRPVDAASQSVNAAKGDEHSWRKA